MGRTHGVLGGKQPGQCAHTSHPWTPNTVLKADSTSPSAHGPQTPPQSLIPGRQPTTDSPPGGGLGPLGPAQCVSHPEVVPLPT